MDKQSQIQETIVYKCLRFFESDKRGYINGTMRLGKIKITIDILNLLYKDSTPFVLITYPDNRIKESWQDEFELWKYYNPNVFLINARSLHKYKDFKPDFFVIDEFHDYSPLQIDLCHQIMTNDGNTKTLGLSGTISKETKALWGLTEIVKYSTDDGISDKILADYQITVHLVDLDTKVKTPNKKGKLLSEKQKYDNYTYVINKFKEEGKETMHLLLSRNRLSTSSLGKMNYLKSLLETLKDKRVIVFAQLTDVADSIGIPSFHSKSPNDDNFQKFQREEINHLSLAGMGKMGVSYTKLNSVILLNATHNSEETAQIAMRAIKLDYIDKVADIHIIALKEDAEKAKIKKSLSMLNPSKITYI